MAYAVVQDAIDLYGSDYVTTSVVGAPDFSALTKALDDCSSQIDSYLASQYAVPVSPIPTMVKRACIDMAIYVVSSDAGLGTEEKRRRYDDAISWLKDIAKGLAVVVGIGSDGQGVTQVTDVPKYVTSPRLFSRATMAGL